MLQFIYNCIYYFVFSSFFFVCFNTLIDLRHQYESIKVLQLGTKLKLEKELKEGLGEFEKRIVELEKELARHNEKTRVRQKRNRNSKS